MQDFLQHLRFLDSCDRQEMSRGKVCRVVKDVKDFMPPTPGQRGYLGQIGFPDVRMAVKLHVGFQADWGMSFQLVC